MIQLHDSLKSLLETLPAPTAKGLLLWAVTNTSSLEVNFEPLTEWFVDIEKTDTATAYDWLTTITPQEMIQFVWTNEFGATTPLNPALKAVEKRLSVLPS